MAPRTKKQFEEIRQTSIQNIVNASLKLFSQRGYMAVAVKDIAKEAGISQGLMYNYFKSKEKLLAYIINQMIQEMEEYMRSTAVAQDPAEQLRIFIKAAFQILREKRDFWEMVLPILTQQSVNIKVRKQLREIFRLGIVQMEMVFKALKVPVPALEAHKLGAVLDGIGWHCLFIFSNDYPLDEMEKKLLADYDRLLTSTKK